LRGYAESGVADAIRQVGGGIFGVTSEPQSLATEASEAWQLGFPCVGDPHHEILGACRERGWLDLFVNEGSGLSAFSKARPWIAHPKGYFQPGVLALTGEGRVLYRWRCRPTRGNLGGAAARPLPGYVWAQVRSRLAGPAADAPLDDSPECDGRAPPWWLFVLMLLAHGWFLRPKTFPLGRADDDPAPDPRRMLPRIVAFAGAWIAAFALLPLGWVALGLVAWAALVSPGLAVVHREFQNVPKGGPDPG